MSHLRAFVRDIKGESGTYKLQFISEKEYEKIISSDWERGPVDANGNPMNVGGQGNGGNGQGQGQGKGNRGNH